MMRSFLERNMEVLRALDAPVYHWLAASNHHRADTNLPMVINRWGLPDWRLPSGEPLFQAAHPSTCYRDWIPNRRAATSATIIIGANLGYGLNQVLEHTPDTHRVFVLEPRPEMVSACLTQTDYSLLIEKRRLVLLPPDLSLFRKTVFQHLPLQYEFGSIHLRSDMPSRRLGPEYSEWGNCCRAVLEDFSIEMNTFRVSHEKMIRNELANYPRAMRDGSLRHLKGGAAGVTAVMLGAGPSLERFAPFLVENSGDALYVAAFQTLPTLRSAGLKPHMCMLVDFTETMAQVLERVDNEWISDIPLIYSCKACPDVLERYPGPMLPLWTVGGLGPHLWQASELVLNTGRNVGVALFRFLVWCGAGTVMFVGQDFAWSGEKTHASGHSSHSQTFRFNPDQHVKLKNKFGETIFSAPVYLTALQALENELAASGIRAFNLYGGNAVIKGAVDVDPETILKDRLLCSEPGSRKRFLNLLESPAPLTPPQRGDLGNSRWTSSIRITQKRLEKLFKKSESHQQEIQTTLNQLLQLINRDAIYQPYLSTEIRDLSGMMFGKTTYRLKDMAQCRQILKRVMKKVREMDRILTRTSHS